MHRHGSSPLLRTYSLLALALCATGSARAQSHVVAWGDIVVDSRFLSETFVDVDAGGGHSYGLRADGSVAAWGANDRGQCLVPALPAGRRYVEVRAGGSLFGPPGYGIARRDDGSAIAWGLTALGTSTELDVPAGLTCIDVAAATGFFTGGQRGHALLSDGSVLTYSSAGSTLETSIPALPAGLTYSAISAGSDHGLLLRSDGVALGWGNDFYGQASPPAPPAGRVFVELDAGEGHSVGRLDDGSLMAWGDNTYGQINLPALPAGVTYVDVEVSANVNMARRSDGALEIFGAVSFADTIDDAPPLPPGTTWVELGLGVQHGLGLRSDGVHLSWGQGFRGALNVPAPAPGAHYASVAAGRLFVDVLTSDGQVLGFGEAWPPAPLPAGVTYVDLDAGWNHSLGLRSDGQLVGWGNGNWGQNDVPALPPGTSYVDVSAGGSHSLALRSDGQLVGFGRDNYGQATPPAAPAGLEWVELATADDHSYARASDGSLVGFGYTPFLGTPALPPGRSYVEVQGGGFHTLARLDDGSATAWGNNFKGQGDVPTLAPGTSWTTLVGYKNHGLGLTSNGELVAWGNDDHPQLRNLPQLGPGQRFAAIDAGFDFNVALIEPGPACGSVARYCTSAPNSAGPSGSTLELSGCVSLGGGDLLVSASGLPPGQRAFLRYAPEQQHVPFGAGIDCLAGPASLVPVALTTSPAGTTSLTIDLAQAPFDGANGGAGPVLAGSTWNLQLVHRDDLAPGAGFNTSDALHLVVAP